MYLNPMLRGRGLGPSSMHAHELAIALYCIYSTWSSPSRDVCMHNPHVTRICGKDYLQNRSRRLGGVLSAPDCLHSMPRIGIRKAFELLSSDAQKHMHKHCERYYLSSRIGKNLNLISLHGWSSVHHAFVISFYLISRLR